MSRAEYNRNRQILAEIQGVDLSAGTHTCHHREIYRYQAKINPSLRRDLDKIDNLFLLPVDEHNRLHQELEAKMPEFREIRNTSLKSKRRKGRRK
jgi:hypothetical protein